jgi:hypothetical protein
MAEYKSRITGRIEEWWKKACIKHNCKYYMHEDYPKCSYCTYPNNCIIVDEYFARKQKKQEDLK